MTMTKNKKDFKKVILDYLWYETLNIYMSIFVFMVMIIGLFYANHTNNPNIVDGAIFYTLLGVVGVILAYVCFVEFRQLNSYKKILKSGNYTVENCVSREVSMKMNRAKKEIELISRYESDNGELSDEKFVVLSNNKALTVPECEGKECKYIRLTDNYGFIFVE